MGLAGMKPVGLGIDLCRGSDHIFAGIKYSLRIRYKWLAINHSARKFPIHSYSSSLKTFLPTSTLASSPEYLIARCWPRGGGASIMIQFDHLSFWEIVLRGWKWPNWLQRICREVFQLKSIIKSADVTIITWNWSSLYKASSLSEHFAVEWSIDDNNSHYRRRRVDPRRRFSTTNPSRWSQRMFPVHRKPLFLSSSSYNFKIMINVRLT